MIFWIGLDLLLAVFCEEKTSLFVLPFIFLLWALELRSSISEDKKTINIKQDQVWIRRGRISLILFLILVRDEHIFEFLHKSEDILSLFFCFLTVIMQIEGLNQNLNLFELTEIVLYGILVSSSIIKFIYPGNRSLILVLQAWVITYVYSFEFSKRFQFNISPLSPLSESKIDSDTGELLLEAMAPEIILRVFCDPSDFVFGVV